MAKDDESDKMDRNEEDKAKVDDEQEETIKSDADDVDKTKDKDDEDGVGVGVGGDKQSSLAEKKEEKKTKNENKEDNIAKTKKTNTTPKIRVDIQEKIMAYFGQQLQIDRRDVPKEEVAQGCGFAKSGSHGFFYAWQDLIKNKSWITKGKEKACFRLTDVGKDKIPEGVVVKVVRRDHAGMLEFFKENLLKQCKAAKHDKIDIMFEILQDGKSHGLDEFTKATGYANLKSRGLGDPFSWMQKKMKILEKDSDKKYILSDKCFPDGRPS